MGGIVLLFLVWACVWATTGLYCMARWGWRMCLWLVGISSGTGCLWWVYRRLHPPVYHTPDEFYADAAAVAAVASAAAGVLSGAIGGLVAELIKRVPRPGHCPRCGYNLTGNLSGVCPECGTPVREDKFPSGGDQER